MLTFTVPATGNYLFQVAGAQGGTTTGGSLGGLGAMVNATVCLQQGANVTIIVAGQGSSGGNRNNQHGAGGGGLSAIYTNSQSAPVIVAGTLFALLVGHGYHSRLVSNKETHTTMSMTAKMHLIGNFSITIP